MLRISVFFLILFTADAGFNHMISQIHREEGDSSLGPYTLAMFNGSYMIMSLFISRFKGIPEKWQVTFASLAYCTLYFSGVIVSDRKTVWVKYLISGTAAAINGIGGSFLWVGLGSYIHKTAHLFNQTSRKGKFYGLFSMIISFCAVGAGTIVTVGLPHLRHWVYFLLVFFVGLSAFFYGLFFVKDLSKIEVRDN